MACGWHYTKLSLSSALFLYFFLACMRLGAWLRSGEVIGWLLAGTIPNSLYRVPFSYIFFWHVLCVIVPFFLLLLPCFVFMLSDLFPVQQTMYRIGNHVLGMVEVRSVHVENTTTTTNNIQRIVLATEETTVIQQVSHRPIKCQSRLWSKGGTEFNGSHHGDNPLLRPTGIQIATKSYATLQAPLPKRFTKPPYSIPRATSIDSDCLRKLERI